LTKANAFVDMVHAPPNPRRIDVDQYGQALISDIYGQIWSQDGLYFVLQEGYAIEIGASNNEAIWALNQYGEPKKIEVQERIYLSGAKQLTTYVSAAQPLHLCIASNPIKAVEEFKSNLASSPYTCSCSTLELRPQWSATVVLKEGMILEQQLTPGRGWKIQQIEILNAGTDHQKLANAEVMVDDKLCGTLPANIPTAGLWHRIKCASNAQIGAKITIKLTTRSELSFCGIRVYGSQTIADRNTLPGVGVHASISNTGVFYMADKKGTVYTRASVTSAWTKLTKEVFDDAEVVSVSGNEIWKMSSRALSKVYKLDVATKLWTEMGEESISLAVAPDATWIVTKSNEIKYYKDNKWTKVAGRANRIASGVKGEIFIITNTSTQYKGYSI
jgi:hypothetical protein